MFVVRVPCGHAAATPQVAQTHGSRYATAETVFTGKDTDSVRHELYGACSGWDRFRDCFPICKAFHVDVRPTRCSLYLYEHAKIELMEENTGCETYQLGDICITPKAARSKRRVKKRAASRDPAIDDPSEVHEDEEEEECDVVSKTEESKLPLTSPKGSKSPKSLRRSPRNQYVPNPAREKKYECGCCCHCYYYCYPISSCPSCPSSSPLSLSLTFALSLRP